MSKHFDQLDDLDHLAGGFVEELGQMWHGFGKFARAVPREAVERVLTVTAEKRPLFWMQEQQEPVINADGDIEIATFGSPQPVTRGDKPIFGIFDADTGHCFQSGVTDGYLIHPYLPLLEMTAEIVGESADTLEYGCAVALGNKEQMMVQIRMRQGVVVGGDKLLPWLACYSSLNSTWATGWKLCATRLQCDNTAAMVMGEKASAYQVKHTRHSALRVGEARRVIGLLEDTVPRMVAEVDRFQHTSLSDNQFRMVVDKLVPVTGKDGKPLEDGRGLTIALGKRATIHRMWTADPRVNGYRGSVWGAIQAVSTAATHEFSVRGASRYERQVQATVTGAIDTLNRQTVEAVNAVFDSLGMASVRISAWREKSRAV